jgi:Fe-S-cluster containining protein
MRFHMFTSPPLPEPRVTLTIGIEIFGERVTDDYEVPAGRVRPRRLLPVVRALAETVVDRSIRRAESEGRTISCRAGCGACCRQLVPISRTEAHGIRELVESLPEPRRADVEARFSDARRRLEQVGLLERLLDPPSDEEGRFALATDYFAAGIPCPFLEDESCSIHPERPVVCREYLVTSPAEHCAEPSPETVAPVHVSSAVSERIHRMEAPSPDARWVPLALAPAWSAEHPEEPASRTAPELLGALLTPPKPKPERKRKGGKRR